VNLTVLTVTRATLTLTTTIQGDLTLDLTVLKVNRGACDRTDPSPGTASIGGSGGTACGGCLSCRFPTPGRPTETENALPRRTLAAAPPAAADRPCPATTPRRPRLRGTACLTLGGGKEGLGQVGGGRSQAMPPTADPPVKDPGGAVPPQSGARPDLPRIKVVAIGLTIAARPHGRAPQGPTSVAKVKTDPAPHVPLGVLRVTDRTNGPRSQTTLKERPTERRMGLTRVTDRSRNPQHIPTQDRPPDNQHGPRLRRVPPPRAAIATPDRLRLGLANPRTRPMVHIGRHRGGRSPRRSGRSGRGGPPNPPTRTRRRTPTLFCNGKRPLHCDTKPLPSSDGRQDCRPDCLATCS
jgi:hypothetical protein